MLTFELGKINKLNYFSEMELSSPGDEYQNKSLEFGFSDETTSASSIDKGKNDNNTRKFFQ